MKKFKSVMITLIIIAMIASIFAGCNDNDEDSKDLGKDTPKANSAIKFPVKEDVKIDICMAEGSLGEDPNDASALAWLIKESGIDINIIGVTGGNKAYIIR